MDTISAPAGAAAGQDARTPLVSCANLRRVYGDLVAVQDISFNIAPGETYGILGPNGAGKTTVISMVAGVLRGDGGSVTVDGHRITPQAVEAKAVIGYVPQDVALYPDLTGRENLRFFARIYGMNRARSHERVEEVLQTIELADRGNDLVSKYSGGMKRRLNIAAGLLHRPRLLILDEPTVGVDPQSRNAILANVERLAADGMAVLYTTHYMEEAERLCDRLSIIDSGRMICEGTVRELISLIGEQDRVLLTVSGDTEQVCRRLRSIPGVRSISAHDTEIAILVDSAANMLPAIMSQAGTAVRSVAVQEPDLEAVFLHLTGKKLRD